MNMNNKKPYILCTDGVQRVAENAGAHWLIYAIISNQILPKVDKESFQAWTLKVKDSGAVLTCTDGNKESVYSQKISYTDFPLPEITFWLIDKVLMLPTEY